MILRRWCDMTGEERRECVRAILAGRHGVVLVGIRTTKRPEGGIDVHYFVRNGPHP